eukprot:8274768-Pyramimonas_sp.AAC.1
MATRARSVPHARAVRRRLPQVGRCRTARAILVDVPAGERSTPGAASSELKAPANKGWSPSVQR